MSKLPRKCSMPSPRRAGNPSNAFRLGAVFATEPFALPEMLNVVKTLGYEDAEEMLHTMIDGKRLRDISDLPLDLVV